VSIAWAELSGVGPFFAEMILLGGAGDPNSFPRQEKRLHQAVAAAYQLGDDPPRERIAEGWRPYRSWAGLQLRNAGWLASR
jgi:DNA-3-methyladenine glycosylase II